MERRPGNVFEAQFSLPYLMGLTLMGFSLSKGISEKQINDSKILRFADMLTMTVDDGLNQMFTESGQIPSKVVVHLKDGAQLERTVIEPKGAESNKMTEREMRSKFFSITTPVVGNEKADALFSAIMNLEQIEDLGQLTQIL